ncbi:hypothetical protein XbrCFBP1976_21995, partial [Xanthomonas bromi]
MHESLPTLQFEFGLWTLSLIGALINRQFGKTLLIATVGRLMQLLVFSAHTICRGFYRTPTNPPRNSCRVWSRSSASGGGS